MWIRLHFDTRLLRHKYTNSRLSIVWLTDIGATERILIRYPEGMRRVRMRIAEQRGSIQICESDESSRRTPGSFRDRD